MPQSADVFLNSHVLRIAVSYIYEKIIATVIACVSDLHKRLSEKYETAFTGT